MPLSTFSELTESKQGAMEYRGEFRLLLSYFQKIAVSPGVLQMCKSQSQAQ